MTTLAEHGSGHASKRLKIMQQMETRVPRACSAAYHDFKGIMFDVDIGALVSDEITKCDPGMNCPSEREQSRPHPDHSTLAIVDFDKIQSFDKDLTISGQFGDCLGSQEQPTSRRSFYVDAFNLALETVLDEESHLFDEKEMMIFDKWKQLNYETQYLYVRLFLRKSSSWHRISRLAYHSDISDISAAVRCLKISHPLPQLPAMVQITGVETEDQACRSMGNLFTFADALTEDVTTLEEVSSLLSLEELKSISKEAKIWGKNKTELVNALRRMSRVQSGLGSVGVRLLRGKPDPTTVTLEHSVLDTPKALIGTHGERQLNDDSSPSKDMSVLSDQIFGDCNRDKHFILKILGILGPCIRLSYSTLRLFERVHLVYYRSTKWTEKSLTTILLVRIQQRSFPRYVISRSANIFPSRTVLLEFEASIRLQHDVDIILESGMQDKQAQVKILSIFEKVYSKWQALLAVEQDKEEHVYKRGDGAYLRLFSPCWVYTRIIHKTASVLGRLKMYSREHSVLTKLLEQRLFVHHRGSVYQRKALLEEHYMSETAAIPVQAAGVSQGQLKKYWKRESLKTAEEGLQDPDCHIIYHYDLQKRIMKLEKGLKIPKREQHDFGYTRLTKPQERDVCGIQIRVIPDNGRRTVAEERQTLKTVWVDERDGGECSVEAMCLSWYRSQGWKGFARSIQFTFGLDLLIDIGYHAEGGILQTLFAYLFYDVIFASYIPNVFQTPFQSYPLDLHTEAFFPSRASEIRHRLTEISNGDAGRFIRDVNDRERCNRTCVAGLNWDFSVDDLLEIVACFDSSALANICMVMAQDYRRRGSGVPDLFLWNPKTTQVMFSEVKSKNDRLSDAQRLWIHVLLSSGIEVELCNAVAREVRTINE